MKTELVAIKGIPVPVVFYIGRTQEENHDIIALAMPGQVSVSESQTINV